MEVTMLINFESQYAAEILFAGSIFFGKASLIAFIQSLTPKKTEHWLLWGLTGLTVIWTISSIFAIAFQCQLPHAWSYINGRCIDRVGI
jgi:FtsH-binding integral membrane protein